MQLIEKTDLKIKLFEKIGIGYDDKLTFKHQIINENKRNEIVPWESQHTPALQKSRYLVIENDVEQLVKTFKGN